MADVPDEIDLDNDISWELSQKMDIQPTAKLNPTQLRMFEKFKGNIKRVVATDIKSLGTCKDFTHKIRTTSETPIFTPPYRKSQAEREEINKQCDEHFRAGIIRHSKSPWSFPLILVPKPNKTKRLCFDYRRLNAVTVTHVWPMKRILDILDHLNGSKWWTSADLKVGIYQILMDEVR